METLLTHGYFLNEDRNGLKEIKPYPLLGILYLSSFLKLSNIPHFVFDSTFSSRHELMTLVKRDKPSMIGFYVNLWTKPKVLSIINEIRKDSNLKHSKIVLGGPDTTFNIEDYLNYGADYMVIGEGEKTFKELVTTIEAGKEITEVNGIAFKNSNGEIIKTLPRARIKDLDSFGFPNRTAIDLNQYFDFWKRNFGYTSINISTQRGCPYSCNWCNTGVFGHLFVQRSVESVASETEYLFHTYKPDTIRFVEDLFTYKKEWVMELCATLKKRNNIIPFECTTRAEYLDEEIIENLKMAGCYQVWVGIESGSQTILNALNTKTNVMQNAHALNLLNIHGIRTGTFVMLGYPKETLHDVRRTMNFLKETKPDNFAVSLAFPIKGTPLYNQVKSELIKEPAWNKYTDKDVDFKRTYPRIFYRFAASWIVNEFIYFKIVHNIYSRWEVLKFKIKSIIAFILMNVSSVFSKQ